MTDAATTTATPGAGADGAQAQPGQQAPAGGVPTPADLAAQQQAQAQQQAAQQAAQQQQQPQPGEQQQDTNPNAPDMTGWPQAAIDAYRARDAQARRYQQEAGDSRINAKNAAREEGMRQAAIALAKAAGIELPGEEAPTIEGVTQQLQGVTAERDEARVSAALTMTAWQQQVDPGKLGYLQYQLSTDPAYKALDPTAADFSDKLSAIVASKIAADATLKAAGTASASGVESLGGASGNSAITQERFNSMSMEERTALYTSDRATYDQLAAGQYKRG